MLLYVDSARYGFTSSAPALTRPRRFAANGCILSVYSPPREPWPHVKRELAPGWWPKAIR